MSYFTFYFSIEYELLSIAYGVKTVKKCKREFNSLYLTFDMETTLGRIQSQYADVIVDENIHGVHIYVVMICNYTKDLPQ